MCAENNLQTKHQYISKILTAEECLSYYQGCCEISPSEAKQDKVRFPKVSILIITYNNLLMSQLCLRSIYCNTTYLNFEVIVVDNASTDETPLWLQTYAKTHSNLRIILNPDNRGFAAGNNQSAREATGEYLIFLNNDTIVTWGWVERLMKHMQSDPKIGLVGPVTNATGNEALVPVNYNTPPEMEAFAADRARTMFMQSFDIRMLAFYCIMTRKEQYEALGGLDERYSVGMFEDDDLAIRYHQQGLKVICAEDVFIHHFQGASFGRLDNERYKKIFEGNRKKYEEKWGHKWQPYKSRNLPLVDTKQIKEQVVIDWGPRSTEQGKPVNVQPSGKSAIWIEVTGLSNSPDTEVFFGGRPMEDICIHDHGINAAMPTSYLADIGAKDVVIKDHHSGRIIFVGEFNIVPAVKLAPKSVALPLVDLITSYYAAHNFLSDTKRFPNSITQEELKLFKQGVDNLERLLSHFISSLNCLLLSNKAAEPLIEKVNSDPAESEQWAQFCHQVERLKISTVLMTRALCPHVLGHNPAEKTFQIPADSQETTLEYNGNLFESFKRHNLELMYLESLAGITMPLSTPGHLLLGVSNRCNFRCRTCFQSVRQNFAYNDLPSEAIKNLQPFLPSCYSVNIAGAGEPLLSPHTPHLIQIFGTYGVLMDLVTNGSLLSRLEGIEHNIEHICISMDGASSETVDTIRSGARFNQIIADIKKLPMDIRHKIIFNMVVCRANVHEIHKLVKLAKELGISAVGLQEFSAYLPWHASMKLLAEDQPLLMQQIRASRKELARQSVTSFIVACATHDEINLTLDKKVIKPDYRQILKMLDQVQSPVEFAKPQSWIALALEFKDATLLKIPKVLLNTLVALCDNSKHKDSMKVDLESQDAAICSRRDSLVQQLNAEPVIRFPHCLAPYTLMNIHSDGTVKPCCILDRRCGSLTTDSAHRVWYSPAYVRLRQSFATGMDLPQECIGCKDGVRFGQAVKLLANASYLGINISKVLMPTDGCVPGEIMDMITPHSKSIGVRKIKTLLLFTTELLINPNFTSANAWLLFGTAKYDANARVITASLNSPAVQYVAVSAGHHYLYTIVSRSIKDGALGYIQIKWMGANGQVVKCRTQPYECMPTWTKHKLEVIAPPNAVGANVFISAHTSIPLEFKSCSFRELIFWQENT